MVIIGFGVLMIPSILLGLYGLKSVMLYSLLVHFEIQNDSGQAIEVMPIGLQGDGTYGPLPRYEGMGFLPHKVSKSALIPLKISGAEKVTYDYDDISFRCFLITDGAGEIYLMNTDNAGSRESHYGPQQRVYIVPRLETLAIAPVELRQCLNGQYVRVSKVEQP